MQLQYKSIQVQILHHTSRYMNNLQGTIQEMSSNRSGLLGKLDKNRQTLFFKAVVLLTAAGVHAALVSSDVMPVSGSGQDGGGGAWVRARL